MAVLIAIPGVLAFLCWLVAAGSALELAVRHPAEGRSALWYAVRGMAFFDPDNFAPSGAAAHRRMLMGFGGFVLCVAITVGLSALQTAAG